MIRNALVSSGLLLALWGGAAAIQNGKTPQKRVPPLSRPLPHMQAAAVQAATPKRPPALQVQVTADRPAEPLTLTRADVDVVIAGYAAQTTMTLTFHNPHSRILEGELVFPLPEGAVVSGYGLDVGGEMVDGVVVEKHAARVAFETETRRRVDPGLVEWVQGNNFRTRVWPIPAQGSRTVKVQYVSDLVTTDRVGSAFHHLPLGFGQPIDRVDFKARVLEGAAAPEIRGGALSGLPFERGQGGFSASSSRTNVDPGDFSIAVSGLPGQTVAVEETRRGDAYFAIDDFPEPTPAGRASQPQRIGLFWDASFSAARTHSTRERALLERWLQELGTVEVRFVAFRNRPEAARSFALPGGLSQLLAHVDSLPYDGGTSIAPLRFTRDCAYHVLFSDGLANLDAGLPAALEAPVYAVAGDTQANHPLLREIGQRSGGAYVNLQRLDDEAALAVLGAPVFSFLGAEHEPGAVAELQPAGRQAVQGRFTLAGRLLADEATLKARFGTGSGATVTRTYVVRRTDAADTGGLVARLWAQQKVAALSVFPEQNRTELLATGRQFGLVTPGTSLLVLETLEQHLEHGVEPPASRRQMQAQYLQLRKTQQRQAGLGRQEKLERVVAMWEAEVRWWEKDYKDVPKLRRDNKSTHEELEALGYVRSADQGLAAGVEGGVAGGVEGGVAGGVVGGVVGGLPAAEAPRPAAPLATAPPAFARQAMTLKDGMEAGMAESAGSDAQATVSIRPWDPTTPYLTALRRAGAKDAYAAYLRERETWGSSPAFFLDCADHLLQKGQRELGLRVLTTVVELQLEEPRLLRVAAHRLQQASELDLAIGLFDKVRRLRPEEPQSLRDLALAHAARADARRAGALRVAEDQAAEYLQAVELLNDVVLGEWDNRFPNVEVLALLEANRILAVLERGNALPAEGHPVDPRLVKLLDTDVRIVLTWDTDQTDMDLWVVEPTGEQCQYSHALTTIGGRLSRDFTGGYGPEEYAVRRARPGRYAVKANYYGSREQRLAGPTTVQATIITNFGRAQEERRSLTLRLEEAREVVDVGEVSFANAQASR
jgi:Ca-activated chloride channel homolog